MSNDHISYELEQSTDVIPEEIRTRMDRDKYLARLEKAEAELTKVKAELGAAISQRDGTMWAQYGNNNDWCQLSPIPQPVVPHMRDALPGEKGGQS